MKGPLVRLADQWVSRRSRLSPSVQSARDAVSHLKPIAVITGGSRGIGAALALEIATRDSDVAIVARSADVLKATAERIKAVTGRDAVALQIDVTDPSAAASIERELTSRGYYLDVLVNNAAIGLSGPFEGHSARDIDRLIACNITAPTRLMLHVLPHLRARQRGGVLNVGSLGGYVPGPYQAAYYASKSYLQTLTEAVAAETSGLGLRISVLVSGPVNTEFHADMGAESALYRRYIPALSPERAARIAWRNFILGRRVIVPGLVNWLVFAALRLLPHTVSVPLVAWLLAPRQRK